MSRRVLTLVICLVTVLAVFAVYFGFYGKSDKNITKKTEAANGSITLSSQAEWTAGTNVNTDLATMPGSIQIDDQGSSSLDLVAIASGNPDGVNASADVASKLNPVDNNTSTKWSVSKPILDPDEYEWWTIDLGQTYSLSQARIYAGGIDVQFKYQVSSNGTDFTDLTGYDLGTEHWSVPNWTAWQNLNGSGRYLRVYFRLLYNEFGAEPDALIDFYELQVSATGRGIHTSAATQLDAGSHGSMNWTTFVPSGTIPANTSIDFRFRTSADAATWGSWTALTSYGASIDIETLLGATDAAKRYLQVETTLANTDGASTPTLGAYTANYEYQDLDHVTINTNSNQAVAANNNGFPNFVAHAWDASDVEITPATFTWSASCGTVTSTGAATAKFYAPASVPFPPTCVVTATTTIGGITKSGTTNITIVPCDIWFYTPAPGQNLPTDFRTFVQAVTYYSLLENNGQLNTTVSYTYSDDVGSTFDNVGQLGYFTTPKKPKNVTITATASCGGTAQVTYSARKQAPDPVVTEPPITIDPTPTPEPTPEPKPPKPCKEPKKTCIGPLCSDGEKIYLGKWSIPIPGSNGKKKLKINDCEIVIDDPIVIIIDPDPGNDEICSGGDCLPLPPDGDICIGDQCQPIDGPITIPIENDDGGTICSGGVCVPLPKDGDEICLSEECIIVDGPVMVIIDPGPGGDQFCSGESCLPIPPDGGKICVNDQCIIVDGPITITPGAPSDGEICSGGKCIAISGVGDGEGGICFAGKCLILDGPLALAANSALIAAIAGIVAVLSLLLTGLGSALTMLTPGEFFNQLLSRIFGIFAKGKEKKQTKVGIVYDAASSLGIPMAQVLLFRSRDQKLIAMAISDKDGRFALETPVGEEYFVLVKKFGFSMLKTTNIVYRTALAYDKNYFGGSFRPKAKNSFFIAAIPMRYSVEESELARRSAVVEKFVKVFRVLNIPILIIGFLLSILAMRLDGSWFNISVFVLYILIFAYYIARYLTRGRTFGLVVKTADSLPIDLAVVRAFSETNGKLVKTSVSNLSGHYNLALPRGYYKLLVEKPSLEQASPLAIRVKSSFTPRKERIGMREIERETNPNVEKVIPDLIRNPLIVDSRLHGNDNRTVRIFDDAKEIIDRFNKPPTAETPSHPNWKFK